MNIFWKAEQIIMVSFIATPAATLITYFRYQIQRYCFYNYKTPGAPWSMKDVEVRYIWSHSFFLNQHQYVTYTFYKKCRFIGCKGEAKIKRRNGFYGEKNREVTDPV